MKNNGIMPTDKEAIAQHRIFLNGNALTPARFWEWRLFNVNRPIDENHLKQLGFFEQDLQTVADKYNGISYTLLKN